MKGGKKVKPDVEPDVEQEIVKNNTNEIFGCQGYHGDEPVINVIPLKMRESHNSKGYDYDLSLDSWLVNV